MNLISIESRRVSASLARFRWSLLWCGIHLDQSTDVFDVCVIVKLLIKPSPHQGQHEISGMKLILWTKPRRHSLTASVGHLHASTLRPSTRRDVFTLRLFVHPPSTKLFFMCLRKRSKAYIKIINHVVWRHIYASTPSMSPCVLWDLKMTLFCWKTAHDVIIVKFQSLYKNRFYFAPELAMWNLSKLASAWCTKK